MARQSSATPSERSIAAGPPRVHPGDLVHRTPRRDDFAAERLEEVFSFLVKHLQVDAESIFVPEEWAGVAQERLRGFCRKRLKTGGS